MGSEWFEALTGFRENSYEETQSKLAVDGGKLISKVNGCSWAIGEFEMLSLAELRARTAQCEPPRGYPSVNLVQGDVRQRHADPAYTGALFQVPSQFNALEMTGPDVTPEDGVTRYVHDHTHGPACALAAAPATIYRNYSVPVEGGIGQTRNRQLDGLADVGRTLSAKLSRPVSDLWIMRNGYALCSAPGLRAISDRVATANVEEIDALRERLSIGLHGDVEVTAPGASPSAPVSQAFCSALRVGYSRVPPHDWRVFATLVLEAAYEATLLAGVLQASGGGSDIVHLTLLGGGAFGNRREWIFSAIRHALARVRGFRLDIRLIGYGKADPELNEFVGGL